MKHLAGTLPLVRLILRRDRVTLLIWILVVGLVPVSIAASFAGLYATSEELKAYADAGASTAATVGVLGFVYSATVGGLTAWRTGLQSVFLIVPVSIIYVVRHTRTQEETGRLELLGSSEVGRLAPLTAALLVVFGANLLIGALIASGLIGLGLPAGGALTLGLSAAAAGCVFAALVGLLAQLAESAAPARGAALAVLALAWVVRAAGDLSGEGGPRAWLSWVSPLGWVRLTRAFAGEQWWVFALPLSLTMALTAAAYALAARRDLGAGLLPQRIGPATAAPTLCSPLALAWRLHQGTLLEWAAGAAVFGALLGSVALSIGKFVDVPEMAGWVARMGARNVGDAFLFLTMYVLGQVVSAYAIAAVLRLHSEEVEGRADPVLAAPVSRWRWAGSHLVIAAAGATVVLAILGLTIGLGYGVGAGAIGANLFRLFGRTLVTLPAVWVMAGIAVALYGWLPRFAAAVTWGALAFFLLLELGWELQQVSQGVFNISPFAWVHWTVLVNPAALLVLTAVALALGSAGLWGFGRRDVG